MSFSERYGLVKPKIVQEEEIDDALANGLWQALNECCIKGFSGHWGIDDDRMARAVSSTVYVDFFKLTTDAIGPSISTYVSNVRAVFFQMQWNMKLDFVEFCLKRCFGNSADRDRFKNRVNYFLERENSAYRFVGEEIAPIITPELIIAIEQAQSGSGKFGASRMHIDRAVSLYSDRSAPDYRNAVKEAISAVESVCQVVSGKTGASLGDDLKAVEKKIAIHPAVISAWSKLYGYTSDEGGIRHAMLEESKVTSSEALYMIVSCSAFVNFLIAEAQI